MSSELEAIQKFYYESFRILDAPDFHRWLELWDEEAEYIVNTATAVRQGRELTVIHDNYERLSGRIDHITRYWQAEKPPTRTLHAITNLEIENGTSDHVSVYSVFTLYASQGDNLKVLVGRYADRFCRAAGSWKIARRVVTLEQDLIRGRLSFIV